MSPLRIKHARSRQSNISVRQRLSVQLWSVAAILGVSAAGALPASAALVPVGHPVPQLAPITLDTTTGIEWLDLQLTTGLSIADIDGGAGGWHAQGWRHASADEVCDLYEAYMPPAFPPAMSCPIVGLDFPTVTTMQAAQLFYDYLGDTGYAGPGDPETVAMTHGVSGGRPLLGGVSANASLPYYAANHGIYGIIEETDSHPQIGHFLVRRPGWQQVPLTGPGAVIALGALLAITGSLSARRGRPAARRTRP